MAVQATVENLKDSKGVKSRLGFDNIQNGEANVDVTVFGKEEICPEADGQEAKNMKDKSVKGRRDGVYDDGLARQA